MQTMCARAPVPGSELQRDHVVLNDGKRALEKQLLLGKGLESNFELNAKEDPALAGKFGTFKKVGKCK